MMAEVLNASARTELGSAKTQRLRQEGKVPAVLYGHGKESVHLAIPHAELTTVLRHGSKLVDLRGDVTETALIKEIQWDAVGIDILHLDLTRIEAGESVTIIVPIELRGEAPGVKSGGTVKHMLIEIELDCPATSIPEKLEISINTLELDGVLTVADLDLPAGAKATGGIDEVVAQCVVVQEREEEEEAVAGESAEPEVIGRDQDGEEEAAGA